MAPKPTPGKASKARACKARAGKPRFFERILGVFARKTRASEARAKPELPDVIKLRILQTVNELKTLDNEEKNLKNEEKKLDNEQMYLKNKEMILKNDERKLKNEERNIKNEEMKLKNEEMKLENLEIEKIYASHVQGLRRASRLTADVMREAGRHLDGMTLEELNLLRLYGSSLLDQEPRNRNP